MSKSTRFTKLMLIGSIAAASVLAYGCGSKPVQQAMQGEMDKAKAEAEAKALSERIKTEAEAKALKAKEDMEAKLKQDAEADARMKAEAEERAARNYETTYFDYDKANIRDDQKAGLTASADKLKANADIQVTIEGHCDERGTAEYNLALGQKRADSAKGFLAKAGVAADRIKTVSLGKERPADAGHTEAAWAKNRRVEIVAAP
ncbi:MAG: peptidoglycan-associated lipoprotein Pal [Candidatus Handelsmanbacteria bacterium]|nr:peptidoglycan-associated lipoprotein Pal [Candidatus Handelsmanbacteria bacterium]